MDINQPLAMNEVYLRLQTDIAASVVRGDSESTIRLRALTEVWDRASESGYRVTRGPEIVDLHRAEFPGDAEYVVAVAVGCSV